MENISYTVVIPVYNAGSTVGDLVERLIAVFGRSDETFELIFVDDFSHDDSWARLESLAQKDRRIRTIKLANNYGQHAATLCGMSYASGDYIITMDDDLQHAPEDIPLMIHRMHETGAKAVIAKLTNKKFQWYRRKASDLVRKIAEVAINKPKGLYLSSFRLIEGPTAREMLKFCSAASYFPALLFKVTTDVVNVEVEHHYRKHGESNYTLPKMFKLACRLLAASPLFAQRAADTERSNCVVEKVIP